MKKINNKKEIFEFLGVNDEMEFRQLNYVLDIYSPNRKNKSFMDNLGVEEESEEKEIEKAEPLRERKKLPPRKDKIPAHGYTEVPEKKKEEVVKEDIESKETEAKKISKDKQYTDKFREKLKKEEEKRKEVKINLDDIRKKEKEFISKTQEDMLKIAEKEINKNLERIIKTSETKEELDSIYRNYFGATDVAKKNLLNLCYDVQKIAGIIYKDRFLMSKLSFNKEKLEKIYKNKLKKFKI